MKLRDATVANCAAPVDAIEAGLGAVGGFRLREDGEGPAGGGGALTLRAVLAPHS